MREITKNTIILFLFVSISHVLIGQGTNCFAENGEAPVGLSKSWREYPYPNGIVDRVQVKWYKALPEVKYSVSDSAACDIRFWPRRDMILDSLIFGDTTLIEKVSLPETRLFKWPILLSRPEIHPNIRYRWQVRCYCSLGDGPVTPWSDWRVFHTPGFDPVSGIYNSSGINPSEYLGPRLFIYPNPSSGEEVVFEVENIQDDVDMIKFNIYDSMGRPIDSFEKQVHSDLFATSVYLDKKLNAGVYIVEVRIARAFYRTSMVIH